LDASEPDLLPVFLAERDVACPSCGYNLRGLREARCPECGEAIALRVGLVEPRQAAGIAGLIGLAAGAGMNGLLLGYAVIRVVFFRDIFGVDAFLWLNLGGLIVEGGALMAWLRRWRNIRRLTPRTKIMLVAGCWALTLLNLLLFSVFVK
jgi:hypothetical protein